MKGQGGEVLEGGMLAEGMVRKDIYQVPANEGVGCDSDSVSV